MLQNQLCPTDLFVIYNEDIRLIIFMGGAISSLLPRSLTSQPKTTVTTPFRLSQHSWKPSNSLGMCQYHNFHDLRRNTTPIAPKFCRTPSTNYLSKPLNFGAVKIGFQLVQNLNTGHSDIFTRLLMPHLSPIWPLKPPWTYFIIHIKSTLDKSRGNSRFKPIYKTWTLIWHFLHIHVICTSQKTILSDTHDLNYLKYLLVQFYGPCRGNFSTFSCSCAIMLTHQFANFSSTPFMLFKSQRCNRLLIGTWNRSAQTLCTQDGSNHYYCMMISHSQEPHKPPWILTGRPLSQSNATKRKQLTSQISKLDDLLARIITDIQLLCTQLNEPIYTYVLDDDV